MKSFFIIAQLFICSSAFAVGSPIWESGRDCQAIVRHDENLCNYKDCQAIIRKDESLCTSKNCQAVVWGKEEYCTHKNCQGIVKKDENYFY